MIIKKKRPIIRKTWINRGIILEITLGEDVYVIPHDDLLKAVKNHRPKTFQTLTWKTGKYSWSPIIRKNGSRMTKWMIKALEPYKKQAKQL